MVKKSIFFVLQRLPIHSIIPQGGRFLFFQLPGDQALDYFRLSPWAIPEFELTPPHAPWERGTKTSSQSIRVNGQIDAATKRVSVV